MNHIRLLVAASLFIWTSIFAETQAFESAKATLEELNRRCEEAREEKLAPLRDGEIARCKSDKRNDPEFCERFSRTFGDATYTPNGTYVPRMFSDLPECVVADQERKRRLRLGEQ